MRIGLRDRDVLGNLRRVNNRLRIAGVVLAALFAAWLIVRGCTPEPETDSATAPTRVLFDATRPLHIEVIATRAADGKRADAAWLEPELRRLLSAAGLHLIPLGGAVGDDAFHIRIALAPNATRASFALIAPDQVLEREHAASIKEASRLSIAQTIAAEAAAFLRAPNAPRDWTAALGVNNANAYDAFTRAASEITGREARGFTRPPRSGGAQTRAVERLEALVRAQPRFVRARGVLALGYLSLGGEDEPSLTQLAATTAEKTLALDPKNADAHAALGLTAVRRHEWIAARERFDSALAIDADNAAALEGLACLFADAGFYKGARPYALRATAAQPRSIGANECLAYVDDERSQAAPRVAALKLALRGDVAGAEAQLKTTLAPEEFRSWARPLLRALASPKEKPAALRAITRAASESQIDASTEILSGAMLKQADFVLNRIARLQRDEAPAPLRLLWLRDAAFLRKHSRFEGVASSAGLPTFWQKHGAPDICSGEPRVYGCAVSRGKTNE